MAKHKDAKEDKKMIAMMMGGKKTKKNPKSAKYIGQGKRGRKG